MIVQQDDGWVRTHDDAEQVLRYAVPGARVEFINAGSTLLLGAHREYVVTLERHGHRVTHGRAVYGLPTRADALARHARNIADGVDPVRARR